MSVIFFTVCMVWFICGIISIPVGLYITEDILVPKGKITSEEAGGIVGAIAIVGPLTVIIATVIIGCFFAKQIYLTFRRIPWLVSVLYEIRNEIKISEKRQQVEKLMKEIEELKILNT
jgi:hypothetical protein